jgi:hypothetical protein
MFAAIGMRSGHPEAHGWSCFNIPASACRPIELDQPILAAMLRIA